MSDLHRVNKVHVETIAQLEETGGDLVKRNWFLATFLSCEGRREGESKKKKASVVGMKLGGGFFELVHVLNV
jgi:hypothetical protein